jgi:hypothetical protein
LIDFLSLKKISSYFNNMEKVLKIISKKMQKSDIDFWLGKSYIERLEAIEFLREQYINYKNVDKRLQRFCRIINKTSG